LADYLDLVPSNFRANSREFVAKKIAPAHFRNLNFQNLSKPIYFRPLLIKTPPQSFKTILKLYHFLTLFVRIFFFLRFRAVAKSRSISALACLGEVPILFVGTKTGATSVNKFFIV
jgi:hypothetical protein